jgi:beta-galactosidase/beta-glucuronidase
MFQRFRFDITGHARNGLNTLAVLIYPVDHPGEPDTQLEVFGKPRGFHKEIMKDVTEVMSVGYDCFPTVPDRNMGIIQEVYVDFTGSVDIRNPFIVTDLPLPETSHANVTISAEVVNATNTYQKGVIKGTIAEGAIKFLKDVELGPGETKKIVLSYDEFPQLVIDKPRLWWPRNYGKQNLYNLSLSFEDRGKVSDEEHVTFGIREITRELYKLDDAHGLRLNINGNNIFCRGGYIQPEMMFDWDLRTIETEIRYITGANLNWVCFEDIPNPPDGLLDLCDSYGLMFWNDFL